VLGDAREKMAERIWTLVVGLVSMDGKPFEARLGIVSCIAHTRSLPPRPPLCHIGLDPTSICHNKGMIQLIVTSLNVTPAVPVECTHQ
jgi:hypothetical protein